MVSRRGWLKSNARAGAALLGVPLISRGRFQLFGQNEYSTRAVDLVQQSLVIDMLGLLTLNWQKLDRWQSNPKSFNTIERKKISESGINVFHPAVDVNTSDPRGTVLAWMQKWNGFIKAEPDYLRRVDCVTDLDQTKEGKHVGIILGLQNSDHFASVDDVNLFYSQGQRISQLTYNEKNEIGAGCTERSDAGLSSFGVKVVERMNQVGMAIDVSHSGDRTAMDAIELSKKPVLITHSNCRALVPTHPRCKSDDVIKRMAAAGGVMGITSIRSFVKSGETATIENVLQHFDYMARLVGVEHVGVGSDTDLDGRDRGLNLPARSRMDIEGLNHPKRMFDLTEGLVRRGYTNAQIQGILGGNFRRALSEIWA